MKKNFDNAGYLIFLYVIIIIFSLLIFLLLFFEIPQGERHIQLCLWVMGEIFLIYGGFCLIREREAMGGKRDIEGEIERLEHINEECGELYDKIDESRKNISFLRHDLANHIQTISSVAGEDDKIAERIEKIKNRLDENTDIRYCSNPVINLFVQQRMKELKKDGYTVDSDIMLGSIDNIEYEELCMLYQLLADNIAALPGEPDYIYIRLSVKEKTKKGAVISYRMERRIKEHVNMKKLCLQAKFTYEMDMIRYIAEKLGGMILLSYKENRIIEAGMVEVKKYE